MEARYVAARLLSEISTSRWGQAIRWFLNVRSSDDPELIFKTFSTLHKKNRTNASCGFLRGEYEQIQKGNFNLVFLGEEDYPDSLLKVERPPLFLTYSGSLPRLGPLLGVVGSREILPETKQWLNWNLEPLVREGLVTVSGGARGVDQAVHRISISCGSGTLAILPSGLNCPYPREWDRWGKEVLEAGGALVSELPPLAPMRPHYFQMRNRLIAGFSSALLVLQARRASGSTMSGRLGLGLFRDVGVVPGFPGHRDWLGSCDLLTEGAQVVRDIHDLRILVDRASSKIF